MYYHAAIQLRERGYEGSVVDVWEEYLDAATENYVGSIDDKTYHWLGLLGRTEDTLLDRWFVYLRSLGLTGSLQDMIRQWEVPPAGGGSLPGDPYVDPMAANVVFFWNGEEGATEHMTGTVGQVFGGSMTDIAAQPAVWGGHCLETVPATANSTVGVRFVMPLDITGSYTIDMWGRNITDEPGRWPTVLATRNCYVGVSAGRGFTFGAEDGGHFIQSPSSEVPRDVWTHVAWVNDYENNVKHVYVNGEMIPTGNAYANGSLKSDFVHIGSRGSSYPYNGKLDEIRITKGVRYTENFTRPSGPAIIAVGP